LRNSDLEKWFPSTNNWTEKSSSSEESKREEEWRYSEVSSGDIFKFSKCNEIAR